MPLITIENISSKARIGLWKMTESVDDFSLPQKKSIMSQYRSTARRMEKLATYALLAVMTGDDDLLIAHEPSGRPLLEGWHISISHTRGYVAVALSRECRVAVDIEYIANRVNKVAAKFIRSDENATTTRTRLLHWSAKETAYKYFSEQKLSFQEMRLREIIEMPPCDVTTQCGTCMVDNMRNNHSLRIGYKQNNAYVLTFACG